MNNKTAKIIGKNVKNMTRREFESLPLRAKWNEKIYCSSIVILPLRRRHDSGYRLMDFVAVDKDNVAICRLSGCSDVLHIEGIGGYGYDWLKRFKKLPSSVPPRNWLIDCLPVSGLLRLWSRAEAGMIAGAAVSSFEIYSNPVEKKSLKKLDFKKIKV